MWGVGCSQMLDIQCRQEFLEKNIKKYLSCEVKDVTWHLVISKCTCSKVVYDFTDS